MFSREESKQIRKEFWTAFGQQSPKKWMLYDTKIKEINLKFHFDTKKAQVSLVVDAADELIEAYYVEKLESLYKLMLHEINANLIFDKAYATESGKCIVNLYVQLDDVSIHNRKSWPAVMAFFNQEMPKFEAFFTTYKPVLEN